MNFLGLQLMKNFRYTEFLQESIFQDLLLVRKLSHHRVCRHALIGQFDHVTVYYIPVIDHSHYLSHLVSWVRNKSQQWLVVWSQ